MLGGRLGSQWPVASVIGLAAGLGAELVHWGLEVSVARNQVRQPFCVSDGGGEISAVAVDRNQGTEEFQIVRTFGRSFVFHFNGFIHLG